MRHSLQTYMHHNHQSHASHLIKVVSLTPDPPQEILKCHYDIHFTDEETNSEKSQLQSKTATMKTAR